MKNLQINFLGKTFKNPILTHLADPDVLLGPEIPQNSGDAFDLPDDNT